MKTATRTQPKAVPHKGLFDLNDPSDGLGGGRPAGTTDGGCSIM
ncbi:hypothetical protein ANO14919_075130 [Xylariales sp. No.14919]|nr:hypothetical protein ANO14919_075130 [Xylariales sp. No.14919]